MATETTWRLDGQTAIIIGAAGLIRLGAVRGLRG